MGIVASGFYSSKTCFATACTASLFGRLQGLYDTGDYPYYSECVASPKFAGHHQSLLSEVLVQFFGNSILFESFVEFFFAG